MKQPCECVRCHSALVVPYAQGARRFCVQCGFTWHADSTDEQDELVRRAVACHTK